MKINNFLIFVRHLYGEIQFRANTCNYMRDNITPYKAVKYCIYVVYACFKEILQIVTFHALRSLSLRKQSQ